MLRQVVINKMLKQIFIALLLLIAASLFFYLSLQPFQTGGEFGLVNALWATAGVTIVIGLVKGLFFSTSTKKQDLTTELKNE